MLINVLFKHCSECEEYKQLVINGNVVEEGDYYHDKIDEKIEGFISGLKFCGNEVKTDKEEYVCEYCESGQDDEDIEDVDDEED